MKKLTTVLISLAIAALVRAQEVKTDSAGNYIQVRSFHDSTTGKTFTDYDKVVHPVYKTKSGKPYIIRTSKTGNKYRFYFLKPENQ
jgi:hypothetical protein